MSVIVVLMEPSTGQGNKKLQLTTKIGIKNVF
jgi:hypothetical protein